MAHLNPPYRRILLKLSGEALSGDRQIGIDQRACQRIAVGLKALRSAGIDVGVVIGGGNIFRGIHLEDKGLARTPADNIGMLATLINGVALQQAVSNISCPCTILSGLECPKIVDMFSWRRTMDALEKGFVVLFVGGTGNPYFTTDTAAALRASEIKADILLKATKVDGVYNKDPMKHTGAVKYESLSYAQALADNLQVMDPTSFALCKENNIPILVFNMALFTADKILSVLTQRHLGTLIEGD